MIVLLQVAIAKNLGLLTLRIADAITLPLNTTQYSLELDDYLDAYVEVLCKLDPPTNNIPHSVETIASTQNTSIDFSSLRTSITNLQNASHTLDIEKDEAEKTLRKLIETMLENSSKDIEVQPKNHFVRGFMRFMGRMLGLPPPPRRNQKTNEEGFEKSFDEWVEFANWEVDESSGSDEENRKSKPDRRGHRSSRSPRHPGSHPLLHPPHPPDHIAEQVLGDVTFPSFIEAVKRVRRVNRKLSSFESGFISEGGIKDREWYRHLGVAPGKWLGTYPTYLFSLRHSTFVTDDVMM